MPWGRVEDDLHDNGKVGTLSDRAFRVWWYSISYCNKKRKEDPEGHLSRTEAVDLCQRHSHRPLTARAVEAVIQELSLPTDDRDGVFWEPAGKGFIVHDFNQYGPNRTPVTPEPPKDPTAAERQRRHRDKERGVTDETTVTPTVTDTVTDGVTHMHARPVPVPVPEPCSSSTENPRLKTDTLVPPAEGARAMALVGSPPEIRSLHVRLLKAAEIAFGHVGQTESERRKARTDVHELASANPPVTVDEFGELVAEYRRRGWRNPSLHAIVTNLGKLRAPYDPGRERAEQDPNGFSGIRTVFADVLPAMEGA